MDVVVLHRTHTVIASDVTPGTEVEQPPQSSGSESRSCTDEMAFLKRGGNRQRLKCGRVGSIQSTCEDKHRPDSLPRRRRSKTDTTTVCTLSHPSLGGGKILPRSQEKRCTLRISVFYVLLVIRRFAFVLSSEPLMRTPHSQGNAPADRANRAQEVRLVEKRRKRQSHASPRCRPVRSVAVFPTAVYRTCWW